jgi:hypothetical protein
MPAPPNCNNDGLLGFVSDPNRERVPGTGTGPGTCAPAAIPGEIGGDVAIVALGGGVMTLIILGTAIAG